MLNHAGVKRNEPIDLVDPQSGEPLMRSGVMLAFFLEPFVFECATALTAAFDRFIEAVPDGALKWAVVSATSEQWRKADAKVIKRLRDALEPGAAKKRRFTAFRLNDAGMHAPHYGFTLSERDKGDARETSRTLVQMTFPPHVLEAGAVDDFVALVEAFVAILQPAYGYCSPALLPSDVKQSEAFVEIQRVAMAQPVFDAAMNELTQLEIGARARGARWLTFLGPTLSAQVKVPKRLESSRVGEVVVLRAGRTPEIALLREMARLLEPVTLFGEMNLLSYFANFDAELLQRWERRFLR